MNPSPPPPRASWKWFEILMEGFSWYLLTTLVVLIGVAFGVEFLPRQSHRNQNPPGFLPAFGNWDGVWYARIVREGYSYDPDAQSSIAFFPVFPLAGRALHQMLGVSPETALLLVAHASLIGLFGVMLAYVRDRYPTAGGDVASWTALAIGLWPLSFFFRAAYTESTFLLICALVLFGLRRGWNTLTVALLIGLATATRSVGVALIPVLWLHLWQSQTTWMQRIVSAAWLTPLACWGLLAFMAWQYFTFDTAFAFAQTQENWATRSNVSFTEQLWSALTLGNIWTKYDPTSNAWWGYREIHQNPLFSLDFANSIYFLAVCGAIAYGAWKRWLNAAECLLCAGVLLIPYGLQGNRTVMLAQGRFASAAFPLYLVLGQLLSRLPPPVASALLALSSVLLAINAALFAAWYRLF
jgi:hypothetical protein